MAKLSVPSPLSGNASLALNRIRALLSSEEGSRGAGVLDACRLAQRLRVGPGAVRRAFEALELENLLCRDERGALRPADSREFGGGVIAELDCVDPISVMDARLCVEPTLAALCAQRATQDDDVGLMTVATRMRASRDDDETELWDGVLHRLIARAARSSTLYAAYVVIDEARASFSWRDSRRRARSAERLSLYDRQHPAMVDAIAYRDSSAANWAMAEHLDVITRNLTEAVRDTGS